jgi:hypothetical protein
MSSKGSSADKEKKEKEKREKEKKEAEKKEKEKREKEKKETEKKEKETEKKEKKGKGEKGKEDKAEKEKPVKAKNLKVFVPKRLVEPAEEIARAGLDEQLDRGCPSNLTIELLNALMDVLVNYNENEEDHTKFVTRFHDAWEGRHCKAMGSDGRHVDKVKLFRETTATTDAYNKLKQFHDAIWDSETNEPNASEIPWKVTHTAHTSKNNDESRTRIGNRPKKVEESDS